jgi:formate hydrogenlyase subunit 6/NADH:ubiquinone oxidoreductase subunit I
MIFQVFKKKELAKLFELLSGNTIVGPVEKGRDRNNKPLYDFNEVTRFEDLALDYPTTIHSPKRFVLPYREQLCTFNVTEKDWDKHVDINVYHPLVFFGMHACDINALNKLDKVLAQSVFPIPYYMGKRQNMFIIGMDCEPSPQCFCQSMGAETAITGFDMFLTDIGDKYFAEILSPTAYNLIRQLDAAEPDPQDDTLYKKVSQKNNKKFATTIDTSDLTKILDLEFDSKAWEDWGDKCLSCGTCANVCPTCYCYGVDEHVELDLKGASKDKYLYSCNLHDFAQVAGRHNFRPLSSTRLKYRYYHKHRGFVETFEESLCVGCGRCGEACLADITPPEVIASVRGQE